MEGDEDADLPPALVTLVRHAHKALKQEAESALAEERAELEASRRLWEVKYDAMEAELEDAKHTIGSQKDTINGVVGLKNMFQKELAQYQEVSMRNKLTNDELNEDLEKLTEENHRLSQSIAVENERHQSVMTQRDTVVEERDALVEQLKEIERSHQDETTTLHKQLQNAVQENNALSTASEQYRYKQAELSEEIKQLRKERDRLIATRDKQANSLHELEVAHARLKQQVVGLEQRLAIAEEENNAAVVAHKEVLSQQKAHIDSLKATLKTYERKRA